MRAMAVLPVLCYLMLRHAPAGWRNGGVALGILAGFMISASRVAVQAHSVSETVAGVALGLLVSLVFICLCRAQPLQRIPRWMLALGLLSLAPATHAEPAPTSRWINDVALYLSGHAHPYDRATWRMAGANETSLACGTVQLVLRNPGSTPDKSTLEISSPKATKHAATSGGIARGRLLAASTNTHSDSAQASSTPSAARKN
jgi:hypothetical protein